MKRSRDSPYQQHFCFLVFYCHENNLSLLPSYKSSSFSLSREKRKKKISFCLLLFLLREAFPTMTVHTVGKKKISIGVLDFVGFEVWRLPEVADLAGNRKGTFYLISSSLPPSLFVLYPYWPMKSNECFER